MKKLLITTAIIVSGFFMPAGDAHSLTLEGHVYLKVRTNLSMDEYVAMIFGVVETSQSDTVIHLLNDASGPSTTANMIDDSTMQSGQYIIYGSTLEDATIQITAEDGGNESGFAFTEVKCKYTTEGELTELLSDPITSGGAPGDQGTKLYCDDVKLQITGGTPDGIYAPEIAFHVDYE